jgi:hypothetical protein
VDAGVELTVTPYRERDEDETCEFPDYDTDGDGERFCLNCGRPDYSYVHSRFRESK